MILRFRNLGIIESADIDLSKPFIVFTGPNGTGKTYMSYVLSGLTTSFGGFFMGMSRRLEGRETLSRIFDPSRFITESTIKDVLDPDVLYDLFLVAVSSVSKSLLSSLNIDNKGKPSFSIRVLTSREEWKEELKQMELNCGFFLHLEKKAGTFAFKVSDIKTNRERLEDKPNYSFELALFLNSVFFHGASSATMFTAERTGISIFSKELAVGRLNDDTSFNKRYPKPISKSLAENEDRTHYKKHISPFDDLANEIETSVLKGGIEATPDGNLILNQGGNTYELALASSTTKALADVVFYIRHRAQKMSRLIIDEPEIHLHPNNQLLLTRIFSRMINRGLRLVISTHSDYIIREINNLIMLKGVGESVREKYFKDEYSVGMALSYKDLAAYMFDFSRNGRVKVKPIKITETGLKVISIDETISQQNELSEDLFYRMRYDKEESS